MIPEQEPAGSGGTWPMQVISAGRVSVITPVRNAAASIAATIESVAAQDYLDIEHLIVDGGSSDGTAEVIRRSGARVRLLEGTDSGIYDGMNRGIDLATGEWLLFLGANDTLARPTAISELLALTASRPVLVYGDITYDSGFRFRSRFGPAIWLHNTIHHQGALYHRSLFESFRYDATLQAVADYELNLSVHARGLPVVRADFVVSRCTIGGRSSDLQHRTRNLREINAIRRRYVGPWRNALGALTLDVRRMSRQLLERLKLY